LGRRLLPTVPARSSERGIDVFFLLCSKDDVQSWQPDDTAYVNTVWSHSRDSPQSASNGVQIKLRLAVGLVVSRYQTPLQFWAAIKTLVPRKPKTFQDARLRSRCRHDG
jgi:hypothetical protein